MDLPLTLIAPNPRQPRTEFDSAALDELAQSMHLHGQIQSILVEENPDGTYTLVAGERRTLAARQLGWETIRADVRPNLNGTGDRTRLIEALVENLNRDDMHPLDEAAAFHTLHTEFSMSMVEIGNALGKGANGQQYVYNRLILLKLDAEIHKLYRLGWYTNPQVAAALLAIPDPDARVKLAKQLYHNRVPYKAAIRAAQKLADALRAEASVKDTLPAFALPDEPEGKARYDALVHVGLAPAWPRLKTAVTSACRKCVWHDNASPQVCGECPVVNVLENLLKGN